ncbi:MAG: NADP-dependent phosphogluconate dehydrogenase [Lachnospiraceae bacterium]|nr:NADP-dependent phosphogluconate dehydrogenase [Lachnospiraceae bacterium]
MKIGFIGVGKMGLEMATRLKNAGHEVYCYDVGEQGRWRAAQRGLFVVGDVAALCAACMPPRVIWIQTPPGEATGEAIAEAAAHCQAGDILVDGGNSDFRDSLKRARTVEEKGIHFIDAGVSGGVKGAKEGCGLLVGASQDLFERLTPVFEALAARGGYVRAGNTGAGHFAKMVHNGVEYAIMEAYGEGYELLSASDIGIDVLATLKAWQGGCSIRSLLLEKMIEALEPDVALEGIADFVADSGMGRWTVEEGIRLKVPTPAIYAALQARFASQQAESPNMKSLAALRGTIGGHPVKKKGE